MRTRLLALLVMLCTVTACGGGVRVRVPTLNIAVKAKAVVPVRVDGGVRVDVPPPPPPPPVAVELQGAAVVEFFGVPLEGANHLLLDSEPGWPRWLEEVRAFLPSAPRTDRVFSTLTPRERGLLELIAQGRDNAQIAATLGLSEKTVRNHITSIFAKLEVDNRALVSCISV